MMAQYNFHFGKKEKTLKQWVIYSVSTAVAVSLLSYYGTSLLRSRHGAFVRDALCSVSRVFPNRLLSSLCRTAKTGRVTEDDAKTIIGRAQQAAGIASDFFDNDRANTDLRAKDEVSFAVEEWKRLNPSPKIDQALRKQHPLLSEAQLCVLSQAERYVDGDAVGIRYVGMQVCEEEVKPL
jgi:uncharacterized protein YjbJ (UPF0337 family)